MSTNLPEPLSGKFVGSFAYLTIRDRLPIILTKVIDCLYRERQNVAEIYGSEAKEETKTVVGRLSELRNEMVTNKLILPLKSDGPDVGLWNSYLDNQRCLYGFEPAWFDSPWLYSECYMYRRIKESFELSSYLQDYDPFHIEKKQSLLSLLKETSMLATMLHESVSRASSTQDRQVHFEEFRKFLEICLWGNRFDLSISAGSCHTQENAGLLELSDLREFILANDTEAIWETLESAANKANGGIRIDLVLDNAGFELFSDLCLLEYLDSIKFIGKVHIYVKMLPWFVSDTLTHDIDFLFKTLGEQNSTLLVEYAKKWRENIDRNKWVIEIEKFWTLPHDYSEMKSVDPELYNKLSKSNLIIFKGDLNYRKLTSDRQWLETTPFVESLRGFCPAPLCTLRTIKCDVITGLKPGVVEEVNECHYSSSKWRSSGKYAVMQFATDDR